MRRKSTEETNGRQEAKGTGKAGAKSKASKAGQKKPARPKKAQPHPNGTARSGPTPGVNGQVPHPTAPQAGKTHGRLLESIQDQPLRWFLEPWIGRDMLNVIVGKKNVGKSSLLAWLMAKAHRPAILPGYEESVELMMVPRWRIAGVNPGDLLILDDQHYSPQLQTGLMVQLLKDHGCDLLVIENLDSYLPEESSENDSQCVRPYLEALQAIAVGAGVALVGTRHPGKVDGNICRGSQAWENAPRITLVMERENGPPPSYWLWSYRCGVGPQPDPIGYTLPREGTGPALFTLAEECDHDALRMAQAAPDPNDRARLEVAKGLLETLLKEDWVEARVVFVEAEKERLGEGTVRRAARLLGVQMRREGSGLNHKSFWGRHDLDIPWGEADLPK